jgi:hypothetical protein
VEVIMKTTLAMISVLVASVLCLPGFAAAQGTGKTFDQLSSRLQIGNTVRVTDTEGREVKGKLTELRDTSITVNGGVPTTFEAGRVRLIQNRTKSYGMCVGLGVLIGGAIGVAMGAAYNSNEGSGPWESAGPLLYFGGIVAGIGAGAGAGIGAAIPAKWKEVYRAPGASASARVSIAPMVTPRTKGVVLSFSF